MLPLSSSSTSFHRRRHRHRRYHRRHHHCRSCQLRHRRHQLPLHSRLLLFRRNRRCHKFVWLIRKKVASLKEKRDQKKNQKNRENE